MARKVFFSFHYQRDYWRVNQVRNSWVIRLGNDATPFYDRAEWEKIKRQGSVASWIEKQLSGSSVTVVLIGTETAQRRWVQHEIKRSIDLGKGLLGIYIHNLKDSSGNTGLKGANPLPLDYPIYDWVDNDGYRNIGSWVEQAWNKANQ